MKFFALIVVSLAIGCVDVPDKFDCSNVDCIAIADQLCEDGYFQFCKDLTQDELDRIFACLLLGNDNCLDAVNRNEAAEISEKLQEIYAPDRY